MTPPWGWHEIYIGFGSFTHIKLEVFKLLVCHAVNEQTVGGVDPLHSKGKMFSLIFLMNGLFVVE
jgi:hypothetical protein